MSKLQIILLGVFIAGLLAGVLIFAGIIPVGTNTGPAGASGDVVIWGTVKRDLISNSIDEFNRANKTYRVIYIEKDPATLDADLTEALASGRGPDLFFMPDDLIIRHTDKLFVIPYQNYPESTFRSTFITEGELYLTKNGILGLPFLVDPMVMYYNRDILEGAGVVNPPLYWSDFENFAKTITTRGQTGNIIKSAISFGEFANVAHAKDLLSLMLIQAGNPIVSRTDTGYVTRLADSFGQSISPANAIMDFYTKFSNPTLDIYSWNRSLSYSKDAFIAGDLATYFGYASEVLNIKSKNPNLNFDVVKIPQTRGGRASATFGKMYALAIAKSSKNLSTAYVAATALVNPDLVAKFSQASGLPPALRGLLANKPTSPYYASVFYDSALIGRAWLDPSTTQTDAIYRSMVEDITSGRLASGESVQKASNQLTALLGSQ